MHIVLVSLAYSNIIDVNSLFGFIEWLIERKNITSEKNTCSENERTTNMKVELSNNTWKRIIRQTFSLDVNGKLILNIQIRLLLANVSVSSWIFCIKTPRKQMMIMDKNYIKQIVN